MAVCSQAAYFNESSCLCQTITTYLILPALYVASFIVGLAGNLLSLWIFMTKISTKTPTHIYLINLGFSNLIMCITMPFNAAYYALGSNWPASSLMCELAINVLTPVLHINIEGGMLILTWLALSRFSTLIQHNCGQRPSRFTKLLPKILLSRLQKVSFAIAMCVGTWAVVLAAIIPLVILYSTMETDRTDNNSERSCYGAPVEIGGSGSQVFTVVGITVFFLCLLLVISAYISVIRHMKRTKMNSAVSDRQSVYSKVCRNLLVIQIVVVICLVPHHIYKAIFIAMIKNDSQYEDLEAECHPYSICIEVKNILLFLAVLRGSTDPILYFLLDKTFKKYARGLLKKSLSTKESQSSRTVNGCGQLNQDDSAIEKLVLKHSAPSYSKDSKTEQTSNNQ